MSTLTLRKDRPLLSTDRELIAMKEVIRVSRDLLKLKIEYQCFGGCIKAPLDKIFDVDLLSELRDVIERLNRVQESIYGSVEK